MAGGVESVPRSRLRGGTPKRRGPNPVGRQLDVGRSGLRDERCDLRARQRTREERERTPRGAAPGTARVDRAVAQQGRPRGRPDRARVEHELGPRIRDGESGGRRDPRGLGPRAKVRGRVRRGLGRPTHPGGRRDPERPGRPPRPLPLRRRVVRGLPPKIESRRKRHKAPRAGANACLPRR